MAFWFWFILKRLKLVSYFKALEKFYEDSSYDIPESAINLQWCHVLPSMKKGQLVNISHKMPSSGSNNSMLKDYKGLREYWKCQVDTIDETTTVILNFTLLRLFVVKYIC